MGAAQSLVESRDILGTLMEEKMILIKAHIVPNATRFSIDLACLDNSIPFQFSTRFDQHPPVVLCNTYYTYAWGTEERASGIPFHQGESFEMTITIRSEYYEVSVNRKHFLKYVHRLPYHAVKKLQFRGDITVEEVSYSFEKDPPPYSPPLHSH